jgi:hypothetical protein
LTSISGLSSASYSTAAAWTPPPRPRVDSAEPAAAVAERYAPARGVNSGIQDPGKLSEVSRLLAMEESEVTGQVTKASDLWQMLQSRGVDPGRMRDVLSSGDLLDVRA